LEEVRAATATKDKVINRPGRPKGSLNKITRTMKDAIVAAAEELGHIDFDKWRESNLVPVCPSRFGQKSPRRLVTAGFPFGEQVLNRVPRQDSPLRGGPAAGAVTN